MFRFIPQDMTYPYGAAMLVVSQLGHSFHTPLNIAHLVQDIGQTEACLKKESNNHDIDKGLVYL